MSRIKGGCLDWLSDYHFKEAHDFYWQRSSQQHCQHCLRHCFSKDPVDISFQVLYNRNMPSYSAGLGGNYAALPPPPPPHIKIISHRICANLRIDPKGRYKNGNPFKNGNYHPCSMQSIMLEARNRHHSL